MLSNEATIIDAATAWAVALAELEQAKQHAETADETPDSAELSMHSVAAHVDALRCAERALYQAVQLSGARRH